MLTAYVIVTLLAAGINIWAAYVDFKRAGWVVANMKRYGIPQPWLFRLGMLKALGAVGLAIGIVVLPIGIAASLGTVVRAQCYSHLLIGDCFIRVTADDPAIGLSADRYPVPEIA